MNHEIPELTQPIHRNGRATNIEWYYTNRMDAPEANADGSADEQNSLLKVEPSHVLPLLLGAILAGAIFGLFWKRK
ncbi:MAG: hypothetical protein ABL888_06410 [Pirellulaceae bacterium]